MKYKIHNNWRRKHILNGDKKSLCGRMRRLAQQRDAAETRHCRKGLSDRRSKKHWNDLLRLDDKIMRFSGSYAMPFRLYLMCESYKHMRDAGIDFWLNKYQKEVSEEKRYKNLNNI